MFTSQTHVSDQTIWRLQFTQIAKDRLSRKDKSVCDASSYNMQIVKSQIWRQHNWIECRTNFVKNSFFVPGLKNNGSGHQIAKVPDQEKCSRKIDKIPKWLKKFSLSGPPRKWVDYMIHLASEQFPARLLNLPFCSLVGELNKQHVQSYCSWNWAK